MIALVCFIWAVLVSPFKSKSGLAAENAALRQQLTALQAKGAGSRRVHKRPSPHGGPFQRECRAAASTDSAVRSHRNAWPRQHFRHRPSSSNRGHRNENRHNTRPAHAVPRALGPRIPIRTFLRRESVNRVTHAVEAHALRRVEGLYLGERPDVVLDGHGRLSGHELVAARFRDQN